MTPHNLVVLMFTILSSVCFLLSYYMFTNVVQITFQIIKRNDEGAIAFKSSLEIDVIYLII